MYFTSYNINTATIISRILSYYFNPNLRNFTVQYHKMIKTKKRKDISTIEIFKIVQILEEKSKSRGQLALDYEISESTISKIWTKREDIKEECKDHLCLC